MTKANEKALLMATGIALIGAMMLSNPRCDRGCRTVAEHLLDHGISDLLGALLA
jgi:hypothetical protein